jgi:hypothetical protein
VRIDITTDIWRLAWTEFSTGHILFETHTTPTEHWFPSMSKALKEIPDQFSDLSMISHADVDDSVDVCRKLISRLYDPKGKSKRCHSDLNRFCVKLGTYRFHLVKLHLSSMRWELLCKQKSGWMHTKLGQLLGHLSSTVGKRERLVWNLSNLKVKCHLISFTI